MKRLLLLALTGFGLTLTASAALEETYLLWQVKPIDNEWTLRPFDYAILTVTDQGGLKITELNSYTLDGDGPYVKVPTDSDGRTATFDYTYNELGERTGKVDSIPMMSALGDYARDTYGFVVEAYLDGQLAWHSGVYYYDQLTSSIWQGTASALDPDVSIFTMQVPEPTSALLLLLGLAGLSLKRKVA